MAALTLQHFTLSVRKQAVNMQVGKMKLIVEEHLDFIFKRDLSVTHTV